MNYKDLNILFVIEKYCDGKPEMGLSNSHHNLLSSLKHSLPEVKFNTIHYDECIISHNIHIDKVLSKIVDKYKSNVLMFSLMNRYPHNPSMEIIKEMKNKGLVNVFHYPDFGVDNGPLMIDLLGTSADLHVSWDNADSTFHNNLPHYENHLKLFVPQDPNLYFKDSEQDINVSFIGSLSTQERQVYLGYLQQHNVPFVYRGGQRNEKLSPEQYASLIRKSKMSINFPYCNGSFDQCKGRVFEVLASCSLLLERKNNATSKLFSPGKDYVEYDSPEDLKNKIEYFLKNEKERKEIAKHGHQTYLSKYTAKHFWEEIFKGI